MADDDRPPRAAFLAAAVAITAAMAYLAFLLGAWGFDTRRYGQHEGRLRKLLLANPRLDQVVEAFQAEKSSLVASARGPRELDEAAARWAGDRRSAVVAKGARWPQARVFAAGDMVYFIFFDEAGVMRDFALVSR
ncbi:MAG TPA: hypothetical protein VMT87_13875 [Vicinamibacteria bacterium]|nr:hypothetical protein [Vicinamibacteria bacterium]